MTLAVVFVVVLLLLVGRSRIKKKRRPATATDVLDAAAVQGLYPHQRVMPTSRDAKDGTRDVGF